MLNLIYWLKKDVARNGFYGIIAMALTTVVMIITTPIFIARMGLENYGLWVISMAVLGLMGALEFGLGTAVTKYIAEYQANGDIRGVSAVATISLGLSVSFGIIFTFPLYVTAPWLATFFPLEQISRQQMASTLVIIVLGFFPLILQNVSLSIPKGFQDYTTPTLVNIAQNILTQALALFIILNEGSVYNAITGAVVILWLSAIVSCGLAIRILQKVGASFYFSRDIFNKVLNYMFFMGITGLGIQIFTLLDRVVVAYVLGLSTAAYYAVATGIANKFSNVGHVVTQALLPAFSSWSVNNQNWELRKKLKKATLIMAAIVLPLGFLLLLISKPLLVVWLGGQTGIAVLPSMQILVFIYMLKTIVAPSFQAVNGLGYPWLTTLTTTIASLGTIGLIFVLGKPFGLIGASWANMAIFINFLLPVSLYFILNRKNAL